MTWHLKDRELEKKLIAIDPHFVRNLQKAVKYHEDETTVEVGFGDGIGGLSRFAAEFRWDELEEIPEYNPHAWNAYPEITPPEGILMRVETDRFRDCAIFKDGYWHSELFGEPNGRFQAEVECFRPWNED